MQNYRTGMQYSSQRPQPNRFGIYGQNLASQDIGTTNSEQMMQGSMGGIGQAMQADGNAGFYGSSQPQYQGMQQQNYGGSSQNWSQGYQQPNQYGSYSSGSNQGIGTTRTEQMMQGGMGGMSQMMQADRNTGYYGPSQMQPQYGQFGGNQNYGMGGSYGGQSYGMQQSYPQSNQYSSGTNQRTGTTQTEQMMQSGMGGLPQIMQADRNTGYYGSSQMQMQPQYGQSSVQSYGTGSFGNYGVRYGSQQPSYSGSTSNLGTNQRTGTTPSEQMMQGGMGGMPQMMQADYNSGYYGPGQQQQWGQYGGYTGMQSNSGTYNPGDTMVEQQAKQNLGVSSTQTPGGDY